MTNFSPLGRLLPDYQTMNRYYDEIYKDAEDNRATNGCEFCFRTSIRTHLLMFISRPRPNPQLGEQRIFAEQHPGFNQLLEVD